MNNARAILRAISITSASAMVISSPAPALAQEFDLLPLLQVDRNLRSESDFDSPVGGYVRFWIERVRPSERCRPVQAGPDQARAYSREARDPVSRLLWGRNYARNLQAKLVVTRSNAVTQSVTLASASHDSSSREGENWRSELGERRFLTPYFRVDQGSTAAIEVSLTASREIDSAVTQNILQIVQRGVGLVAGPTGPLVTALNSDRLNQTTNFVDNAISRLFREKLAETSQSDFPAERWLVRRPALAATRAAPPPADGCDLGAAVAGIAANFPMGGHVWREGNERNVGEWRVYVTEPIVSIFSTVQLRDSRATSGSPAAARCRSAPNPVPGATGAAGSSGARRARASGQPQSTREGSPAALVGHDLQACIAFSGLVPARVLNLTVGENITLGQALRGDAGISAAVQRFQANGTGKITTAREVCNLVAERADALGLNAYDAAAAVWAFVWSGGLNDDLAHTIWHGDCLTAQLGNTLRLTGVPSSASQTPAAAPASVAVEETTPGE